MDIVEQRLTFPDCPTCANMVTGSSGDYDDDCKCPFSAVCKIDYDPIELCAFGTPTHWSKLEVVPGTVYKHFKGNLYVVLNVAVHSETKEKMVVYQAMYGNRDVYVRPFKMFTSGVDHKKYPDVKQELRFEPTKQQDDGHDGFLIQKIIDTVKMQEDYKKLLDGERVTKKAICELGVPFRDKYGLTDLQTLRIMRSEITLSELLELLGVIKK